MLMEETVFSLVQLSKSHPPNSTHDEPTIWETGTARGFSLCMAKALQGQRRLGVILNFNVHHKRDVLELRADHQQGF